MSREFNNLQRALRNYGSGPIGFGVFLTWFYCSFNTSILGLDHGGGLSLEASWCVAMASASAFALLGLRRPAASLWPHTVCAGKALGVAAALVILASASPLGSDTALAFAMAIATVVAMLSCERAAALLSPQTPDRQPCEAQLAANLESILSQQARVAARAYGLSNREEEVLAFLLAGRSRPYIRDALAVSLNTINTHVRRIYAKMDVHSYQELIDRVRGA